MKPTPKPPLTYQRLKDLLSYDPLSGVFLWKVDRNNRIRAGQIAGCENTPDSGGKSFSISIDCRSYRAGRLAWLYMTGEWPKGIVDHRDGNHLNQRWLNLRDVDDQINLQNLHQARANNKSSGLLGVHSATGGQWRARIWVNNKNQNLGVFSDPHEAHQAYLEAKRRLHAGCTI